MFFVSIIAGITAGLLTIFIVPAKYELLLWLALILLLVFSSVKLGSGQVTWMTFFWGVLTGIVITTVHLLFLSAYLKSHPEEQAMLAKIGISSNYLGLLMIAPVYWLVLGLLTGAFAWIMTRLS